MGMLGVNATNYYELIGGFLIGLELSCAELQMIY